MLYCKHSRELMNIIWKNRDKSLEMQSVFINTNKINNTMEHKKKCIPIYRAIENCKDFVMINYVIDTTHGLLNPRFQINKNQVYLNNVSNTVMYRMRQQLKQ